MEVFKRACVSAEFRAFGAGKSSPVAVWLRALAALAHRECGGLGVGALGMCFTGGFALAMMVDDSVAAPVLAQPSLPFPVGNRRTFRQIWHMWRSASRSCRRAP